RMEENGDRELAAQVRGIVQENRMEENGDRELAAQVRGIVQESRMEENGDRELAAQVRGILKEGQQRQRKRPGRVGKEGGVLSHEETIHGTKIQDFDR
ncbi:MAG: hypothetical protein HFH42_12615, partial [Lachnospiraceae bacterium]|nr:hypothetical protein [Lachnospiraceae bacterium]